MEQVVKNANVLANELMKYNVKVLTGGTDNHLILIDLRGSGITGQELENRLASVHIITNKNAIPFDTEKKTITSGLRIGTPAVTSRGLKEEDMKEIARAICMCMMDEEDFLTDKQIIIDIVQNLCKKYPLYGGEQ